MAVESGRPNRALSTELFAEGYRFEFFQAVRILARLASDEVPGREPGAPRQAVGEDSPPDQEIVRFRALPSLVFPPAAVGRIDPAVPDPRNDFGFLPPEMIVTFLGLFGPHGALPQHYTSLVIDRTRPRHKDFSLRDFLDLFNHRTVSLFYRAWEKYRFPCGYERSHSGEPTETTDLFTFCLFCLVGLGTDGLSGRMSFDDEAVVFYGGHYAHYPRCAVSLELLLGDYFDLPVEVIQFRGQWLRLNPDQRSCLPSRTRPEGSNHKLGVNVVVGARVWSIQSKFRVRIGPLTYRQFQEFMPTGIGFQRLCQLTRLYVGQEFDYDVQVVLFGPEVPWCKLAGTPAGARRLGWNSWVRCQEFRRDVDDAVFVLRTV